MARIAITGASGFIGKRVCAGLAADGHRVTRLVRREAGEGELSWDPAAGRLDAAKLAGVDAFIHLSGERIVGARWNESRKREFLASRVESSRLVAETLARIRPRPALLCASAYGFYGDRGSEWVDEASPIGSGFLADMCDRWERACDPARDAGVRVANLRIGLVLDRGDGMLALLNMPFRLGLGGRLGSGTQYMPWVTGADLVAAVRHILVSPALVGPVNLVAPNPVPNAEFSRALGRVLRRPALLPVPAPLLRLALGEVADEALLASARVRPAKLLASGFAFGDPEVEPALRRLLS
jgi:hypothetical protein